MPYTDSDAEEPARRERTIVHLETAQRIATMGSWQTDLGHDTRMYWSREARVIAGWTAEEPEPTYEDFLGMLHEDDRERFEAMRNDALAGRGVYAVDCRFFRRDGEMRYLRLEAEFERDEVGRPLRVIGVVRDVTDTIRLFAQLAEAEDDRRELLHQLFQSSEVERGRLAHQLHDGPIQQLTATTLRLEHLTSGGGPAEVVDVIAQLHEVIESLRATLFELHPTPFGGRELGATLEGLAGNAVPELTTTVDADVDGVLGDELATTIARIAQEALRNVHQHAGATSVDLTVKSAGGTVILEVTDDGRGFDHGGSATPGHLGLVAMQERAEAIGGELTVDSQPGQTVVRACLPQH